MKYCEKCNEERIRANVCSPAELLKDRGYSYCPYCGKSLLQSEPLTQAQLIEMNGQPVWVGDGSGNECWCIVTVNKENGVADCIDGEYGEWNGEFYQMTDADGSLHYHGWVAFKDSK